MNVTEKLQEVADYFMGKIIAGDFEFKSCGKCTATITIDGKHDIKL